MGTVSQNYAFGSTEMILMNAKFMSHALFNLLYNSLRENKSPKSSKFVYTETHGTYTHCTVLKILTWSVKEIQVLDFFSFFLWGRVKHRWEGCENLSKSMLGGGGMLQTSKREHRT